mmetsp:Transcript_60570/g.156594  ORF Transcript_60570/g.156594 Transcript_60570/m.156594 type:complete len:350 (-) Transcript_60570:68-1117(-)
MPVGVIVGVAVAVGCVVTACVVALVHMPVLAVAVLAVVVLRVAVAAGLCVALRLLFGFAIGNPRILLGQNVLKSDLAKRCLKNAGILVQGPDDSSGCLHRLLIRQIRLVQNNNASSFNLFNQQLHNHQVLGVLGGSLLGQLGPVHDAAELHVVRAERRRIENGHHLEKFEGHRRHATSVRQLHGHLHFQLHEEVAHTSRLRDATQFDDDAAERLPSFRLEVQEVEDRVHQLFSQVAACTAILQFDGVKLSLCVQLLVLHQLRVDVDRCDVVHDAPDSIFRILQPMLQQGRFASAQKSAQNHHRHRSGPLGQCRRDHRRQDHLGHGGSGPPHPCARDAPPARRSPGANAV